MAVHQKGRRYYLIQDTEKQEITRLEFFQLASKGVKII